MFSSKDEGLGNPVKLWKAVKDAIDEADHPVLKQLNIKEIMESWTEKAGYPVVSVAVNNDGSMSITQERFLLRNLEKTPKNVIWSIPLTYGQTKSDFDDVNFKYLLKTGKTTVDAEINPEQWIIFNVQSSGGYRIVSLTL
jgi:aminopeptidase N